MKKSTAIITGIATAVTVVAAIFVIKKGPQLKEDLLEKVDDLKAKIKDLEVSEVKEAIQTKLVEIKDDIKDFDWEKPKDEVEKKFYEFKNQLRSVKKHMPLVDEKNTEEQIEIAEEQIEEIINDQVEEIVDEVVEEKIEEVVEVKREAVKFFDYNN